MRSFLFLFLYFPLIGHGYELSICAIFQNEGPYIKEWIDYHMCMGVEHFWLYNNDSSDDYLAVLKPYIKKGIVELTEWPSALDQKGVIRYSYEVQVGAYNDALRRCEKSTRWLAIIDLDEFIVPVGSNSILKILDLYFSNAAGICINWQCYGTSHVKKIKRNEKMIETLLYRLPTYHPKNFYFKSIVRPRYVRKCIDPHYCQYRSGHYHINTNGEQVRNLSTEILVDKLKINHYWTRDEYFLHHVKIPRYELWGGWGEREDQLVEEMNTEFDDSMTKLNCQQKKRGRK
ncbi:MAG: glycosyltransferase family 92 protein [Parachlamydiaceae bacterium]